MKNLHKLFYTLMITAAVVSCDVDKITSLQDTLKIIVNPDAVNNKKEITVVNANNAGATIPNLAIALSGDNTSDIFTSDGQATLNFNGGQIVIGLKQNITPSIENPISIKAELSADGYITKTIDLVFDGEPVEAISVPLLEKANLPNNVKVEEDTQPVTGGATDGAVEVSAEKADGSAALATVTIPDNTEINDENGNPVSGTLEVSMQTLELDAESGSDFNISEEVPNLATENGDVVLPSSVIQLDFNVGTTPVIPSEITLDVDSTEDVFVTLSDGTLYKIPSNLLGKSTAKKSSNIVGGFTIDFYALRGLLGIATIKFPITLTLGVQAVIGTTCKGDVTITNGGASTSIIFKLKDSDNKTVASSTQTIYANESQTVTDIILISGFDYTLEISAETVNGSILLSSTTVDCNILDTSIEISDESKLPTEVLDIPFSITCPTVAIALDQTTLKYKKNGGDKYIVYGKIIDGKLDSKLPVLEANTEYVFEFFYEKVRNTESDPTLGSEIKELISTYDTASICAKIEDEI
jgi:hypothetical protein